jgi:hypothetical protein
MDGVALECRAAASLDGMVGYSETRTCGLSSRRRSGSSSRGRLQWAHVDCKLPLSCPLRNWQEALGAGFGRPNGQRLSPRKKRCSAASWPSTLNKPLAGSARQGSHLLRHWPRRESLSRPSHLDPYRAGEKMRAKSSSPSRLCQSASLVDPLSASNVDPHVGDQHLDRPALAEIAEGEPSASDGAIRP